MCAFTIDQCRLQYSYTLTVQNDLNESPWDESARDLSAIKIETFHIHPMNLTFL